MEVDAAIQDERVVNLISTQVSPVRGAGFKVLYPQLPKRGFGVDSQSALKGFLKYAAASRVTLVHLVRLSQLERFMSKSICVGHEAGRAERAPAALLR